MKHYLITILVSSFLSVAQAQITGISEAQEITPEKKRLRPKVLYGIASYYANKFGNRQTASGSYYNHKGLSAACNTLPLGTWIRVTNLKNGKKVVVEINDRLHPKNKRVVDLSQTAAAQLGYIKSGLTQVRVEVLGKLKPAS